MKRILSMLFFIALSAVPLRANTYTVTNTNDWFWGSFRAAIDDANGHAGADRIVFNIPGTGAKTIHLETPLPNITDTVTIDGWTQPGFFGNPVVELDGTKVTNGLGLMIYAPNTVVRGLVINRFGKSGIGISDDFSGHTGHGTIIQGCWIGVGLNGTTPLPNGRDGIRVYANDVIIGGDQANQRNVIGGNAQCGISIGKEGWGGQMGSDRGHRTLVRGNSIGVNAAGTVAVGNTGCGVEVVAGTFNVIGGDTPGMGNIISANKGPGIFVHAWDSPGSTWQGVLDTTIKNNRIGLGSNGALMGNGAGGGTVAGIVTYAPRTTIVQNVIGNNAVAGVLARIYSGTLITNNSMLTNIGLGIDLSSGYYDTGVTLNDVNDTDTGANGLLNFPVLNSAVNDVGTRVQGTYQGAPNQTFTLDFYKSYGCKGDGYGEGENFVGSSTVSTDAAGNATFDVQLPWVGINMTMVATARDAANNTSEFSRCRAVTYPPPAVTGLSSPGGRVGSAVTIYGSNLAWINSVKFSDGFGGITRVASFSLVSGGISAIVPVGARPGVISLSGTTGSAITPVFIVTPPTGDMTADWKPDLVWRNYRTGANWIANFNGMIHSLISVVDMAWQIQGTGDFNNDGSHDIVWRHYGSGATRIWLMNGPAYTYNDLVLPAVTDTNWHIDAIGDMDRDGDPDLVWRNYATGAGTIWIMNGPVWSGTTVALPAVSVQWRLEVAGDFNLDGSTDLLWRNYTTGENLIWLMSGTQPSGQTASLRTIPDANWIIEGAYDWDQDGDLDVVWRNPTSGQNVVWLLVGTYWDGATLTVLPTETDADSRVEDQ
jgi:hypothetical protein